MEKEQMGRNKCKMYIQTEEKKNNRRPNNARAGVERDREINIIKKPPT